MGTFLKKLTVKAKSLNSRTIAVSALCLALASVMTGITFATNAVYIQDGKDVKLVYTTDNDINHVLASQGIAIGEKDEIDFTGFNKNEGTVTIKRAFDVSVSADGEIQSVPMTEGTVADVLAKAGVEVGENDLLNVSLDEQVHQGTEIVINRVEYRTVKKTVEVPFKTKEKQSVLFRRGITSLLIPGEEGKMVSTMIETVIDGKVVSTELKEKKVTQNPITQVMLVGSCPQTPVSKLTPPDSLTLDTKGVPASYKQVYNGRATAYSARQGAGTASGRRAKVGHVAVNPKIIPYGSKLYIATPDNSYVYGYAIAADTGGALMSGKAVVDLFFNSYEESCQFGVKNVNVYVLK
ncbi:MAG: hypothetical protein K0R90_1064 [Oscillospiraceae bacterium]|jgi:3D (Asp-Asp-Asp) domain-containing protein|nr:hypothetical protein [Oscillospiraceae bacterium]